MKFSIVIPVHNEVKFIGQTLQSLVDQTLLPQAIVVVDDGSTDGSANIISEFESRYDFIHAVYKKSEPHHAPGSKVIKAFYKGYEALAAKQGYDVICKFDADLVFPKNYLETLKNIFQTNTSCGMAGGFCYIEKKPGGQTDQSDANASGAFVLENLTNKDHIRGALKAYRKDCFEQIGKLKPAMGWDTVDELLAQYHGWEVITDESLHVKHLKPTGKTYAKEARFKQGEAFYKMRYGVLLCLIASAKLAFLKKEFSFFIHCLQGYFRSKKEALPFLVSEEEGRFIRTLRWKKMRDKFF